MCCGCVVSVSGEVCHLIQVFLVQPREHLRNAEVPGIGLGELYSGEIVRSDVVHSSNKLLGTLIKDL